MGEKWNLSFEYAMFVNFIFSLLCFFSLSKWATCSYFVLLFFSLHRDLLRIGVTLAGHQKKILGSIQDMRLQMNQTLPVQVWSNRTETDAVEGQPDRKMGELYQREPLENPSCLTHLCQLVAMKLACSASDYFFFFISPLVLFPLPAFCYSTFISFIHPNRISVF